ncbi:hypothetical protein DM01DRAFT_1331343 [Hesseltinella vesiculosa]|uniref:C2H2-type domain-containing protein n=1 Tax=Hesseltinella vesiculosa TaxID=101127 RepID=A0A1X2GV15_9FUNG|nr:hypothetical protein DM01DRAFT_1331343 [Hesseltinella vesiculosa]
MDNEWHTVGNHKPIPHAQHRRRSKANVGRSIPKSMPKSLPKSLPRSMQALSVTSSINDTHHNPFLLPEDDESDDDSSNDESDDDEPEPMPAYHIACLINCPFDDCSAVAPFLDTTALVQHIKQEHQLSFSNLHHMYMALDPYLQRWASIFRKDPASKKDNASFRDEDNVYVIGPHCSELDLSIREDIQRAKLNEILECQQRERDVDSQQPRKCLFCKIVCDSRTPLFKHMFNEHNFNIGLADNLVNVNEFLNLLETKLTKLQCLYCEKTFTSPAVLRKHMRKKKHFKIASKNRQYDRFYVINYLEPGKNWETFEHDHDDSDDGKKEESWADWEEEVSEPTMCLFDEHVLPHPKDALKHMASAHGFDLNALRKEKGYDFYKTIVLINYIRHCSSLNQCFSCGEVVPEFSRLVPHLEIKGCLHAFVSPDAEFWKDPRYMLPIYENDPLLTGFDDDDESDVEKDLLLSDDEANRKYVQQVSHSLSKSMDRR